MLSFLMLMLIHASKCIVLEELKNVSLLFTQQFPSINVNYINKSADKRLLVQTEVYGLGPSSYGSLELFSRYCYPGREHVKKNLEVDNTSAFLFSERSAAFKFF